MSKTLSKKQESFLLWFNKGSPRTREPNIYTIRKRSFWDSISSVYMISSFDDSDYVKIGVSNDPESRVRQLQTGNPRRLSLIKVFGWYLHDEAKHIEISTHEVLSNNRGVGEWFKLNSEEVIRVIEDIEKSINPVREEVNSVLGKPISDLQLKNIARKAGG